MRTCVEAGERRSGQLDGKTTRFWLRTSLSGNEVDGFGSWIIEICTGGALDFELVATEGREYFRLRAPG